jgi:hypothetical protein
MTKIAYEVTPDGDQWLVTRDGQLGMNYVCRRPPTRGACSEAAGELRIGNDVRIEVVGNAYRRAGDRSELTAEAP